MPTCSGQHHIKQLITTPYHKYNYIIYSRFFQLFCGILTVIIPVWQKSFLQQKSRPCGRLMRSFSGGSYPPLHSFFAGGSYPTLHSFSRADHIQPYIHFRGRIISAVYALSKLNYKCIERCKDRFLYSRFCIYIGFLLLI